MRSRPEDGHALTGDAFGRNLPSSLRTSLIKRECRLPRLLLYSPSVAAVSLYCVCARARQIRTRFLERLTRCLWQVSVCSPRILPFFFILAIFLAWRHFISVIWDVLGLRVMASIFASSSASLISTFRFSVPVKLTMPSSLRLSLSAASCAHTGFEKRGYYVHSHFNKHEEGWEFPFLCHDHLSPSYGAIFLYCLLEDIGSLQR